MCEAARSGVATRYAFADISRIDFTFHSPATAASRIERSLFVRWVDSSTSHLRLHVCHADGVESIEINCRNCECDRQINKCNEELVFLSRKIGNSPTWRWTIPDEKITEKKSLLLLLLFFLFFIRKLLLQTLHGLFDDVNRRRSAQKVLLECAHLIDILFLAGRKLFVYGHTIKTIDFFPHVA